MARLFRRTPKRQSSILFAGPFLGEFGWELLGWQAELRRCAEAYEQVYVLCRAGHEAIYEDFATVNELPRGTSNGTKMLDTDIIPPHTRFFDYKPGWTQRELEKTGFRAQRFIRFGTPEHVGTDEGEPFDIVIHARARRHREQCNWSAENWLTLIEKLQGLRIGWMGMPGAAMDFTDALGPGGNLMGLPLKQMMGILNQRTKMIVGPSSGPMHLASLCGCPQVVMTDEENRLRYVDHWNPFAVPVELVGGGWNPSVDEVRRSIEVMYQAADQPQHG